MKYILNILVIAFLSFFVLNGCRETNDSITQPDEVTLNYAPEKIYVTSPWEYQLWKQNNIYTITWAPSDGQSFVKIELLKKGIVRHTLTSKTLNNGEYLWRIPLHLANSNMYYIKITKLDNPNFKYESKLFSIRNF